MKKTVRLTESELKQMISESVKSIIKEEQEPLEERFYFDLQGKIIDAGKSVCYRWENITLPFELDNDRLYNVLKSAIDQIINFVYDKVGSRSE